jgi:PAS domain S-box-containing protein
MNPSKSGRLLFVDDEFDILEPLSEILSEWGYEVVAYTSGRKALESLKKREFDLLLTDLEMPDMDGIEILKEALKIDPQLIGIIITGKGTIKTAVEAMKTGAFDYILKPLDFKILKLILSRAMEVRHLRRTEERLRDLYENAPDGYHSLGPDGTILEANSTWLKMLGYERDEVIAKMKLTDILTDEGKRIFEETFSEFKNKGFVENIDYDFMRKDGTLLPVLINATAVYDKDGQFLRSRSISRDNRAVKEKENKLIESRKAFLNMLKDLDFSFKELKEIYNGLKIGRAHV